MIPIELQDGLKTELDELFSDYAFNSGGKLKTYTQHLPLQDAANPNDESQFPFVIIKLETGEIKDYTSSNIASASFICGVEDYSADQQGYRDCVNVLNRIYQHLFKKQYINRRFCILPQVKWEIAEYERVSPNEDALMHPFYFGGLNTLWECPRLTEYELEGDDDI